MSLKRELPWLVFALFAFAAIYFHQGEGIFFSQSPYSIGKPIVWLVFLSFLAYSYYCSTKENIVRTIKETWHFHWSRQIGLDLYIGVTIFMFLIFLNEGSFLGLALWIVPIIIFANLATLLYLALNYDSIVSHFL